MLNATYWAKDRGPDSIKKSVAHSMCFFAYLQHSRDLVGFARAITDYTTNYYLCDVVVKEDHRGQGIGRRLIAALTSYEELVDLRGLLLTRDAHAFYRQFGFYCREQALMQKDGLPGNR